VIQWQSVQAAGGCRVRAACSLFRRSRGKSPADDADSSCICKTKAAWPPIAAAATSR
jgi:hypothetical protein